MSDDYTHELFTSRAVAEDVARERRYRRYGPGDAAHAVLREVDLRLLLPEHAAWLRSVIDVPGWAMPRHPVPDGPTPYTQLRPDRPVKARSVAHRHNGMRHRPGKCWCRLEHKGPPVPRSRPNPRRWHPDEPAWISWWDWRQPRLPKWARAEHEAQTCEWVDPANLPPWVRALDERVKDGRHEVLVPTGHLDPDSGEIVLPWKANGRERIHRHLDWARYVYVNGRGKAAGIGTHPRVSAALERGIVAPEGLFVFVIEGTLKLDAVISAEWPGIESGSVTLWNAEEDVPDVEWEEGDFGEVYPVGGFTTENELKDFAGRFLQDVPTVIVCDSDADTNWRVRDQVKKAVELLEGCGVPAVGGAPPPGDALPWEHPFTGRRMHKKQGADDWLATMSPQSRHDGFLDLRVWDAKADPPGLERAVQRAAEKKAGQEIHRGMLRELAADSMPGGLVRFSPSKMRKKLRRDESNVDDAKAKHEPLGHWTTVIEAEVVSNGPDDVKTLPPVLRLREDLRPPEYERTLRDWLTDVS